MKRKGRLRINILKRITKDEQKIRLIDKFDDVDDKVELITSIVNEQLRVQLLDRIDDDLKRINVAKTIQDESIRLQAAGKIKEDRNILELAKTFTNVELKIQALQKIKLEFYILKALEDEKDINVKLQMIYRLKNDRLSEEIAKTTEETEIKLQIIDIISNLYIKRRVAQTIKDRDIREKTVNKLEDEESLKEIEKCENDAEILEIAQKIHSDSIKFDLLDKMNNDYYKAKVAVLIEDEELRLSSMIKMNLYHQAFVAKSITDDKLKYLAVKKLGGGYSEILVTIEDESIRQIILQETTNYMSLRTYAIAWHIEELQEEFKALRESLDDDDVEKQMAIFNKTKYSPIRNEIANILVRNEKVEEIKKYLSDLTAGLDDYMLREMIEKVSLADNKGFAEECINNEEIFNKIVNSTKRYDDIRGIILKLNSNEKFKLLQAVVAKLGDDRIIYKYICDRRNDEETITKEFDLIFKAIGFKEEEIPDKVEVLKGMYKTNNSVIKSLNYKLLDDKYLKGLGVDKINLISCYPAIQDKIIGLSSQKLEAFVKCVEDFMNDAQTEEWTTIANAILNNLTSGEYDELINSIKDLESVDIDILKGILQGNNVFDIKNVEDIEKYEQIKKEKTDEWIKSSDIDIKKQAVFEKIFGHDIQYATEVLRKYGHDIDSLPDSDVKYYIKSVQEIIDCASSEKLDRIYEECKEVTFVDKALTERSLKTEFGKQYNEGLLKVDKCEELGENMYLAGTDFKMIITSVGAYINSRQNTNYKDDWNRPALAAQHFCASYIRNDMIGTAPITDICYGFDDMADDSLLLSGASDIYSSGAEAFVSKASHAERYYSPDEQINNTTGYNEMDYRRIQDGKKKQPSYIVVFRKNGEIPNLENAKKAQKDWGGLPIVVVDVDACLESEKQKVYSMIEQYKETKDTKLAKEIYNKLRNNRVTENTFCSEIDIRQFEIDENEKEEELEQEVTQKDLEENDSMVSLQEREIQGSRMKKMFEKIHKIR